MCVRLSDYVYFKCLTFTLELIISPTFNNTDCSTDIFIS